MLRPDAERLEDCVRRGDTRCAVPRFTSEAKAQMFPSIILNVSLFARWYWNVLKCLIVSSPVYQAPIDRVNYRIFGTPVYQPTSAKRLQTSASISAQTSVRYKFPASKTKEGSQGIVNSKYKFILMWPPEHILKEKKIKEVSRCLREQNFQSRQSDHIIGL